MSNLQATITEKYLQALSDGKEISEEALAQLGAILTDGNKPKVDDLVKIFTTPPEAEVK